MNYTSEGEEILDSKTETVSGPDRRYDLHDKIIEWDRSCAEASEEFFQQSKQKHGVGGSISFAEVFRAGASWGIGFEKARILSEIRKLNKP